MKSWLICQVSLEFLSFPQIKDLGVGNERILVLSQNKVGHKTVADFIFLALKSLGTVTAAEIKDSAPWEKLSQT